MQKSGYRQVFAISQSAIKKFRVMPLFKFKEVYIDKTSEDEDTSDSLTFGSLVDTKAFEPKLEDERFYLAGVNVNVPGDKMKQIVEKVYKQAKEIYDHKVILNEKGQLPDRIYIPDINDIGEFNDLVISAAKSIKYGGENWGNKTILEKVYSEGRDYFRTLSQAKGRSIITTTESADADQMVKNLKVHPRTIPYFVQQSGESLIFQQEIYEDYTFEDIVVPLKCAIDILRIVPEEQLVYIVDLKTIYDVKEFREHAKKYGYLEQLSFYRYMVRRFLQTFRGGIYKDFTIVTPFDIAIDSVSKTPYIFKFQETDLEIMEYGSEKLGIKGWRATLDEICWHIKNKVWSESKEMYETGEINLKFFHD